MDGGTYYGRTDGRTDRHTDGQRENPGTNVWRDREREREREREAGRIMQVTYLLIFSYSSYILNYNMTLTFFPIERIESGTV